LNKNWCQLDNESGHIAGLYECAVKAWGKTTLNITTV
jgi:hypothetical protein